MTSTRKSTPSMSDVARLAGVALGTVSNVLNSPDKVAPETIAKVHAATSELGFVRNRAARALAAGTSSTIGFVLADLSNSFFVDMARGPKKSPRKQACRCCSPTAMCFTLSRSAI